LTSSITGPRVATLVAGWLVIAFLVVPSLGLFYAERAAFYLFPPLVLIDAYCMTHRRRAAALLAVIVTVVVVLAVALVALIPKAASAVAR
jgi:predicted PurR-regulated permease PerM